MQKKILSKQKLLVIALSLMLTICFVFGLTFGALKDTKTATGTITFSGNLAVVVNYGSTNIIDSGTVLQLQLEPNYDSIISASDSGNIYLQNKEGQVGSLNWKDNNNIKDSIIFKVISDGNTNSYIKMTLTLSYAVQEITNLPSTAQDWQVYPKFGSDNCKLVPVLINNVDNKEYSFYNEEEGLLITYPKISNKNNSVSKTYEIYYLNAEKNGLKYFEPTIEAETNGYTHLNKEIRVDDIISDIQFLISGNNTVNTGDEFKLSIKCEATAYMSL